MLYFILPDFIQNLEINNFFTDLNRSYPRFFKDENIFFTFSSGSFPYNCWNGGLNNNYGEGLYYNDFLTINNESFLPLCLNFSNLLLEDFDFNDVMSNTLLKLCDNGSNFIEISNLKLLKYIKEKYPEYKFIFSKNAHFLHNFTPEIINKIIEQDIFHYISLPTIFNNDLEFLKSIKNKSKIILTLNYPCNINCKNYNKCIIAENKSQLNYSNQSIRSCNKKTDYSKIQIPSIDEIKRKYLTLGINHFEISNFYDDSYDYIQFLIKYFIKEEYQLQIFNDVFIGEKLYDKI